MKFGGGSCLRRVIIAGSTCPFYYKIVCNFTSCKLPTVTLILKEVAFAQSLYAGMPATWVGSVAGWVMLPTSQKIPAFLLLASCPKARLTDVVGQGRKRKAGILSADFILQDKREKIGRQVSFYYVILPLPNQWLSLKC